MNPLVMEFLPWVCEGYCCSQIMVLLGLQATGEENPALVRSMWGFCQGMAQSGQICGSLVGSVACLGYFTGHGGREAHPMAVPLINDFVEWFNGLDFCRNGNLCPDVAACLTGAAPDPSMAPDMTACGELMALCWEKILELAAAYELDISVP